MPRNKPAIRTYRRLALALPADVFFAVLDLAAAAFGSWAVTLELLDLTIDLVMDLRCRALASDNTRTYSRTVDRMRADRRISPISPGGGTSLPADRICVAT
jgi:hypothetical protein